MPSLLGTDVAANYLVVKQSPGAALAGLDSTGAYPLLTFNTPNLRLFKVVVGGGAPDLTVGPALANSAWSQVVRALQVTSEVFAIFEPTATTFCFMAPDFNTNTGAVSVAGSVQKAIAEQGGDFSILEQVIVDSIGGTCVITRSELVGTTAA